MIAIIDYGMGNLSSVQKAFQRLKVETQVTSNPEEIKMASRIILPGVGHFGQAMKQLQDRMLIPVLNDLVLIDKKPVLGICLGMQLFSDCSEEGNVAGLGWIPGKVCRMQTQDKRKFKIPHMGWNTLQFDETDPMNRDLKDQDEFYFVHSYHYQPTNEQDILHQTEYHQTFVSAVHRSTILGVQYHPEKSHEAGLKVLKNFLQLEY